VTRRRRARRRITGLRWRWPRCEQRYCLLPAACCALRPYSPLLRITRSLEAATDTRTACHSGCPARWKAVSGLWPRRLGTVLHEPELWEIAAPMLPRSCGAVGGRTLCVAHVLRRVAGHRSAVAKSYLVRFFTPSRCGRGHSACCRAPVGRCQVVLDTFLHASKCGRGHSTCCPGRLACCRAHLCCCPGALGGIPCRPGCYSRPSCTL